MTAPMQCHALLVSLSNTGKGENTAAHPGTVVELSDISGPKGRMFKRIAEAAHHWDGTAPIRTTWPME